MTVTINGTSGITTPGVTNSGSQTVSGTGTFASTISVGNVTPAATGAGITFPATQSASSDANTLDDYEEGTWTPVPKFGGANVGMSYAATGSYTKIGRVVHAFCNFSISSNGSSTGNWTIEGLPFTAATAEVGVILGDGFTFTGASLSAAIEYAVTYMNICVQNGGTGSLGGYAYLSQTACQTGGKRICITYMTS